MKELIQLSVIIAAAASVLLPAFAAQADDLDCASIQQKIDNAPPWVESKNGYRHLIQLEEATYLCKAPVVIARHDVLLKGRGIGKTILKLAKGAYAPVLIIGHPGSAVIDGRWLTPWEVRNIRVEDLSIDGNLAEHDQNGKECGEGSCDGNVTSIRNNALTVRHASNIGIKNVETHDSISGGLVTEKKVNYLVIENLDSHHNRFDGFAGYETENSTLINPNLHDNNAAGVSVDLNFNRNQIIGGSIKNNGSSGIFARSSQNVAVVKTEISGNGWHGAFLSKNGDSHAPPLACANQWTFKDVVLERNKGDGLHVGDSCQGNAVTGRSVMRANAESCFVLHLVRDENGAEIPATLQIDPTAQCARK